MPAELNTRACVELDGTRADQATRTVPASLSSEAPVRRAFGVEVLSHDPAAVDLSRAAGGLPLLFGHNLNEPIGVVEDVRIEARRLVGRLRFGHSPRAEQVLRDVAAGILKHLSIGYSITKTEPLPDIDDGVLATRWTPFEASVVSVPADAGVGIGRSLPAPASDSPKGTTPMTTAENTRTADFEQIRSLAQRYRLADFCDGLITAGASPDQARAALLNEMARRDERSGGTHNVGPSDYFLGRQESDQTRGLMVDALAARLGARIDLTGNPYSRLRVGDIAREALERRGVRTTDLSGTRLIERALHTTSDFPALLTEAGNRTLRQAYDSYAGGLRRACAASTARDFRSKVALALGEAPTLLEVGEHGEFRSGTMAEAKSSYSILTYGRIVGVTRQALVSDDLDALGQMTTKMGRAAAEFEAKFLVTLLTSSAGVGPLMYDGRPLFHSDHGNLASGAGSALQFSSLAAGRRSMRLQKGLDGSTPIDVAPRFLIVPAALEATALQLTSTAYQPETQANINPFAGQLEVIVDPRLDAVSTTAWYLAAAPSQIDTLEYSYLEGGEGPQMSTREGFEVDGLEMKVRLDFGAGVLDWRGLYRATGA